MENKAVIKLIHLHIIISYLSVEPSSVFLIALMERLENVKYLLMLPSFTIKRDA